MWWLNSAQFKLDKPHKSFPAGLPGFRRSQPQRAPRRQPGHETGSPNAPGNPGATGGSRRRPRRRGPKAIERSRLRAAAHQALLVAARCSAPTTPTPMPLPAPTPPPFGPTSTRLIKVVPRQTRHRSSFSQVDGQDNNSVDDSDCSSTVADGGGPPTASPPPLQPPREDDLRGERRQQVRQPDLLKKTSLDSVSDGEKPDELTGPTTKTDLSGDVKEAAGREATSPDRIPKYCGTCENPIDHPRSHAPTRQKGLYEVLARELGQEMAAGTGQPLLILRQ